MKRQLIMITILFGSVSTAALAAREYSPPNVILFIGDDISWNDFGCYGNAAARTPRIDALARAGMQFTNAYLTASSCSPSRCSIITGRYPHNLGKAAELHGPMSSHLPMFPTLLRQAGYYTLQSGKHHMPQAEPRPGESKQEPFEKQDAGRSADNTGGHANWVRHVRERPRDRPFFFWFAAYDAHRLWDGDEQWDPPRYGPAHRPEDVVVPPFLADTPTTRRDLASYYNEVTRYDYYIGQVVDELRAQGELENTLILVMADNGRPFPRAKTRLHDSGMKTALVAHWPAGITGNGIVCNSLVSSIDLAPTILKLAEVEVPDTVQGVDLAPLLADPRQEVRAYAFSEHNWHDYEAYGRSVRTRDTLYLINRRPQFGWIGPADSVRSPSHQELLKLRDAGGLQPAQADVLLSPRPAEELYHSAADVHQLTNLVDDPNSSQQLDRLRQVMNRWQAETGDTVPQQLSRDRYDRETGERIIQDSEGFRGTTPGQERNADRVDAPGPR
ncbi:MAG: sulfatase [Planctomycetales bacterium]|nr:sulfatase [Planctomycetales bacterium]